MNYIYIGYDSFYFDELYHHGIKGQKWGIRRFQNKDGSYTNEGLKRRKSGKYVNSDGSLTDQGLNKYSKSKNQFDLVINKHSKAVKDFNKGKISKQALKQLGIGDEEYDFLTQRQIALDKQTKAGAIGSVVGATLAGGAYIAATAPTYSAIPAQGYGLVSGFGGGIGGSIGTIVGTELTSKDLDKMLKSEQRYIDTLSPSKKEEYLSEYDYAIKLNGRQLRQREFAQI